MGFERERVLGIVMERERHLGQRKTCPSRKWEKVNMSLFPGLLRKNINGSEKKKNSSDLPS